jgi:hypothetical protein
MRAREIKIGGVYLAKVSGRVVPVKVLKVTTRYLHPNRWRDQWRCVNTVTGREITVRSPQRFRKEVTGDGQSINATGGAIPA